MESVDCIVVGAGVIGLAAARALAARGLEVVVLEREDVPGSGTSSRNSEVIHAGIYYAPGSLKARLCVSGREQLYRYCRERDVAHRNCGKLIVATDEAETGALGKYVETARRNGVANLRPLAPAEVAELEPEVRCAAALWSPSTGIVDSHEFMQALLADLEGMGGVLACRAHVLGGRLGRDGHRIEVSQDGASIEFAARFLVNAAGLGAQELAARLQGLEGSSIPPRFMAKGYYFTLSGRAPFRHLVYPVACSAGLGIHVTLDLAGGVRFGPDVEWVDSVDYRFDPARQPAFVEAIRRYYPGLDPARLQPGYTGIRPKVVAAGAPAADFLIQGPETHGWEGLVNLFGIESPGLTASLAIADEVAGRLGLGRGDGA
jgi:L-2-hydroxyglutarate oxidase LhgO